MTLHQARRLPARQMQGGIPGARAGAGLGGVGGDPGSSAGLVGP